VCADAAHAAGRVGGRVSANLFESLGAVKQRVELCSEEIIILRRNIWSGAFNYGLVIDSCCNARAA